MMSSTSSPPHLHRLYARNSNTKQAPVTPLASSQSQTPPLYARNSNENQVHERMLESYVKARDRFLKPGGLMLPTIGDIVVAPITDETLHQEQALKASFWETQNYYGIDLST